jgi:negative regulator of sigma E activity
MRRSWLRPIVLGVTAVLVAAGLFLAGHYTGHAVTKINLPIFKMSPGEQAKSREILKPPATKTSTSHVSQSSQ